MKTQAVLLALGATVVAINLGGCTTPQPAVAAVSVECIETRPPTGSHIARRDTACVNMTEAERDAARQAAQQSLQDARDAKASRVTPVGGR